MANKNKLALAVFAALLSSCASLTQTGGPGAAATPAPATVSAAAQATTMMAAAPAGEDAAGTAGGDADNGINREGRVLQLGRVPEAAPPVPETTNDSVELNYEQEDLRRVIEQLGNVLGINMLIDPTIDSKVSLRTSPGAPLRYADIWPLLRLLARNAGVTIEQAGAVWEFKLNASTVPVELVTPEALAASTASTVLQVTPLTHISAEAALAILAPMLQPEGSVVRLGPANLLGISGTQGQLRRVNDLLAVLDDDPFQNQGIQLYELLNSRAADVAEELTSLLTLIEGEQPGYQVLGLDRINAVLVVAPAARGFDEITRWVRILDAESQEQVEQLFVYRVKNLKALTLAETLTQVFDTNDDAEEQATTAARGEQAAGLIGPQIQRVGPNGVFTVLAQPTDAGETAAATQAEGATAANITVTIVADEETNSLLIRATPREYRQLLSTLANMDRVTPQVLIHAVIGQVTLTEGTRFGIDWSRVSGSLSSGPARISSRLLPATLYDQNGNVAAGPGSGLILTRSFTDGSAIIDATLHAIAEDNDVTLLARPTILATNNKEGSIHVGQSVPVNNGTTIGVGGASTQNIGYQPVGIDLKITPQISDDGYVNLQIEQQLSSVEEGSGVAGNPTFTDQSIITSVVVSDESTITLGGLIQEEESDQKNGIPGLVKIPGVGRLFSYTDQQNTRRELFVILRPQIIRGDERDDSALRAYRDSFTHVSALLREAGL